jgi:hypothetical protein
MVLRVALFSACCALVLTARAQDYCNPTFANGCFSWQTLFVEAGGILWSAGADDCSVSDYTALSADVDAGSTLPMRVSNGTWCGCAVWVDLDQSGSFEAGENLFFMYVGGSPSHLYEFDIAIPSGIPTGAYRMRIISPWGSDGFLTSNGNGSGPCGAYQYGDFKDFTLNVSGANGIGESAEGTMRISPNPAASVFTVAGAPIGSTVDVLDMNGRLVVRAAALTDPILLDAAAWTPGVYAVRIASAGGNRVLRVVAE